MISVETTSAVGFYIGDPCYVLTDEAYYGAWGRKVKDGDGWKDSGSPGFQEGPFTYNGFTIGVAHTAHGDGEYIDYHEIFTFPVDSGCIGIVPLELVQDIDKAIYYGAVLYGTHAEMEADDGRFRFTIRDSDRMTVYINVDTAGCSDDEDDENWED